MNTISALLHLPLLRRQSAFHRAEKRAELKFPKGDSLLGLSSCIRAYALTSRTTMRNILSLE